jgi:hypothetical protein
MVPPVLKVKLALKAIQAPQVLKVTKATKVFLD